MHLWIDLYSILYEILMIMGSQHQHIKPEIIIPN